MTQPDTTALLNLLRGSIDELAGEAIECLEGRGATLAPATSAIPMHEAIEIYDRRGEISRAGLGVDGNFEDVVEKLRRSSARKVHIQEFRCDDKHAYLVFLEEDDDGVVAILRIGRR